jgi:hypothetical protein
MNKKANKLSSSISILFYMGILLLIGFHYGDKEFFLENKWIIIGIFLFSASIRIFFLGKKNDEEILRDIKKRINYNRIVIYYIIFLLPILPILFCFYVLKNLPLTVFSSIFFFIVFLFLHFRDDISNKLIFGLNYIKKVNPKDIDKLSYDLRIEKEIGDLEADYFKKSVNMLYENSKIIYLFNEAGIKVYSNFLFHFLFDLKWEYFLEFDLDPRNYDRALTETGIVLFLKKEYQTPIKNALLKNQMLIIPYDPEEKEVIINIVKSKLKKVPY